MKENQDQPASELRRRAEERLKAREQTPRSAIPVPRSSVHELEVHQIELEMQNEELRRTRAKAEQLIRELQTALANVKLLSGLLPICATCKKIRNDQGYWKQLEAYIESHSEATFTHGTCPDCLEAFRKEVEALVPETAVSGRVSGGQ